MLSDWIRNGLPCEHATLLTPHRHLRYSGTVPGWISGQYARDDGLVDVASLAQKAGIQFVQDRCIRIDPDANTVCTKQGDVIDFDLCSIDVGGVGRAVPVLGHDPRILDVRPIDGFVDRLDKVEPAKRIAVIGGGAGGVELAFALRNRAHAKVQPSVTLITGSGGLLPDFSRTISGRVRKEMERQDVGIVEADARVEDGHLLAGTRRMDADLIVAALGSGAPEWPGSSGLAVDQDGFISVDRYQRSTSHPNIFAVGDVAARQDRLVPHSGVHAVFAGPILADNLRAAAAGLPPSKSYRPRFANLYLLSTGRGEAIASFGPLAAQGRWVSRLKHWIDTRWLNQYARLSGTL